MFRVAMIASLATTVSIGTAFAQPLGWVDFNGDGYGDYCQIVGQQLVCFLGDSGTRPTERLVLTSSGFDFGYAAGRAFADVDGDGGLDYCRVIGLENNQGFQCDTGDGRTINDGIIRRLGDDWGYPQTRVWADVDGDGKDDFCRDVGNPGSTFSVCNSVISTGSSLTFGPYFRVAQRPAPRSSAAVEFSLDCVSFYPSCSRPITSGGGGGAPSTTQQPPAQKPASAYVIARTEMQGHGCTAGSAQYFGNSGDRTIVINVHYDVAGFPQYNKDYDLEFAPHTERYEGCNGPAYGGGNVSYRVNSARFK